MKEELDNYLCQTYPKLFVNRHADKMETCMCWGFECGDGWFNILNQLCNNIQHHINWREDSYQRDLKYNSMLSDCKADKWDAFNEYYGNYRPEFFEKRKIEILAEEPREIKLPCSQVTVEQVKEKFGTLRFYYTGGDDYISGLVSMAESMSGVTCETCGKPGTSTRGGWIKTACVEHGGEDFDTPEDDETTLLKQGFEQ